MRHVLQLPFKKAKYDVDIDEPGLGELYGQRLTLKAEVSLPPVPGQSLAHCLALAKHVHHGWQLTHE